MGFTVIPTNIGGVSLNSLASPLASLLGGTPSAQNMMYPSDLGNNPAMGHAVIFQAYDYKTGLGNSVTTLGQEALGASFNGLVSGAETALTTGAAAISDLSSAVKAGDFASAGTVATDTFGNVASSSIGQVAVNAITASAYTPLRKGTPLATISMFMPETMAINYTAGYEEVSMTNALGGLGIISNAVSDMNKQGIVKGITPYAKALGAKAVGALNPTVGGLLANAMGVFTNPQLQLLYKGVQLREFQLSFTLTPKTSAEAQTVKNICDSFAYFSLPGIAGAQVGNSGQFLTPPQVFSVQFKFLGGNGIGNQISNAIYSALNNTGLNVLAGNSGTITGGKPSKTFTVNDCVLTNVSIDYAPIGWATYDDGYPIQTTLMLQFKETTMYTKANMAQTAVAANYNGQHGDMLGDTGAGTTTNSFGQQVDNNYAQGV